MFISLNEFMHKPRLKEKYIKEVVPAMKKEFGYKSNLAVPKIEKVVINAGLGSILKNSSENLDKIAEDIASIAGQKAVITKAKKAVSGFKIRKGMPVGITATLRGARMYEFLDRLISAVFPRFRDFRGLNRKSFDGHGNFNIGIKEHIVFPEIRRDDIRHIFGIEITVATTAKTDEEACQLLKHIGFPIIDNI